MTTKHDSSKKIIIFGDSYADPYYNVGEISWYEMLSKKYEVINHALSGAGPHYSFKKYYTLLEDKKTNKENIIIIFLLSGEHRINFHKHDPSRSILIDWDIKNKKSSCTEKDQYYNTFKSEIDFFFLTMHDELLRYNLKNIGFLHMNSLLFDMKTIVFPTTGIKFLNKGEQFYPLNNKNFYLHPIHLALVSEDEFVDSSEGGYKDTRRNHLTEVNHKILYKNILKILNNDNRLDSFKKNIDYSYNLVEKIDTKTNNFIYE